MKRTIRMTAMVVGVGFSLSYGGQRMYKPTWQSLDSRPIPSWYDEAKFGIFIHWGVYSVPAWAPKGKYAEWYWHDMTDKKNPTWRFHVRTYGAGFRYQDFVAGFKAELFDPNAWADLFARAGARYVVLTAKHHDGFCLWPSAQSWNWNSADVGPHRDLVGDLAKAVRARGMKMGLYYSLYEWFHPLYRSDLNRYVDEHMLPQLKDLVQRYRPAVLWTDGEWDHPSESWKSPQFLAWLFNESPVRERIVVNDRWGKETRSRHGGVFTSEYGGHHSFSKFPPERKWEENRGIGASFGYNRNEDAADYASTRDLIHLLADVVSQGGNLLLDVGPTADGRIPVIMQQRLLEIGAWLKINGEAIYATKPWRKHGDGRDVRYTAKGDVVYAICFAPGQREQVLNLPRPTSSGAVTMLGLNRPLSWRYEGGKLHIELPPDWTDRVRSPDACVFKIRGLE